MRDRMVTISLEAIEENNGLCYCIRYLTYHIPDPQSLYDETEYSVRRHMCRSVPSLVRSSHWCLTDAVMPKMASSQSQPYLRTLSEGDDYH
jgi:hypothetical protein